VNLLPLFFLLFFLFKFPRPIHTYMCRYSPCFLSFRIWNSCIFLICCRRRTRSLCLGAPCCFPCFLKLAHWDLVSRRERRASRLRQTPVEFSTMRQIPVFEHVLFSLHWDLVSRRERRASRLRQIPVELSTMHQIPVFEHLVLFSLLFLAFTT